MSGLLAFVWTNLLPSDRRITSRFRQENESDNVARRFSALFLGRVNGTRGEITPNLIGKFDSVPSLLGT